MADFLVSAALAAFLLAVLGGAAVFYYELLRGILEALMSKRR